MNSLKNKLKLYEKRKAIYVMEHNEENENDIFIKLKDFENDEFGEKYKINKNKESLKNPKQKYEIKMINREKELYYLDRITKLQDIIFKIKNNYLSLERRKQITLNFNGKK